MVSGLKKIICNWNLKFNDKIGLKINIKIKFEQILGSTLILKFFYYLSIKNIRNIFYNHSQTHFLVCLIMILRSIFSLFNT